MNISVTFSDRETGDIIAQCSLDELPAVLEWIQYRFQRPEWEKRLVAKREGK